MAQYASVARLFPPDALAARGAADHFPADDGGDAFLRCYLSRCRPGGRHQFLLDADNEAVLTRQIDAILSHWRAMAAQQPA